MFLLGFISKRVINYTSKYNDDDEGHDDVVLLLDARAYYARTCATCMYAHVADYARGTLCGTLAELSELSHFSPERDKERYIIRRPPYYSFLIGDFLCTDDAYSIYARRALRNNKCLE